MTSWMSSPLKAVLQFAQMSRVTNTRSLSSTFESHFVRATLRLEGLKFYLRLVDIVKVSPYDRFSVGTLSTALHGQSVF